MVGEGAAILADAGAHVGLGSPAQVTVLGRHRGAWRLDHAQRRLAQCLWLRSNRATSPRAIRRTANRCRLARTPCSMSPGSRFDRSLCRPGAGWRPVGAAVTGKVLAGGSVVLSDDSGYVVAQAGSSDRRLRYFSELRRAASGLRPASSVVRFTATLRSRSGATPARSYSPPAPGSISTER